MFSTTIKKDSGQWVLKHKQDGFYSIDNPTEHDYGNCVVIDWNSVEQTELPEGYETLTSVAIRLRIEFHNDTDVYYFIDCPIPEQDEIDVEYVIDLIEKAIDERRTKIYHLSQELMQINNAYHSTYQIPINRQELIEYVGTNNIKLLEGILPMFDNLLEQVKALLKAQEEK